ncbi:MAG TPA: phosphatidate cytidylyltransferase [Thermohalobaculum sp.]|nr:phosphatidate cytidylyltransferase [Thermohalobaculum sp.]
MAATHSSDPPRRFADLKTRIVSAVAAAGVGLTLLYLGGIWTMILIALVTGTMIWEFRAITLGGTGKGDGASERADVPYLLAGVVGGVVVAQLYSFSAAALWLSWSLAVAAVADLLTGRRAAMTWGVVGAGYIGAAGIGFLYLRAMEPNGFIIALWVFLVVAAADVGGYFAGRLIGGPKLWPRVSPKKTWAGAGGGIALAMLLGGLFSWATTGTYFVQVCIVSAGAAMVSQVGDLAESALKRHFGVKDSGRLLPGHGGALDRFDGLVAVALVVSLIVWWRGQTIFIW